MMIGLAETGGYAIIAVALAHGTVGLYGVLRRRAWDARRRRTAREVFRERASVLLEQAKAERDRTEYSWNGVRKFVVSRKASEARDICSFYLEPHDGLPLPPYQPGQYLTFQLKLPGRVKPLVRCYSLSDWARAPQSYCVTVKRLGSPDTNDSAPAGLASSYFHDQMKEGAIVDVLAPRGHFCLDLARTKPIVLIGGGIGITPLAAMLNAICEAEVNVETWLFYGVRCRADHAMYERLKELARNHGNIHMVVCYSRPTTECVEGRDYDYEGHVDLDVLRRHLPSSNFRFYVCGPGPMMARLHRDLEAWGVPPDDIHFEAFGADSVKPSARLRETASEPAVDHAEVVFAKSGKTLQWNSDDGVLLDFAVRHGVAMDSGCRAGNCGTCVLAVKEGNYEYMVQPGATTQQGTCLACVAIPNGRLILDA